MDVQLLQYHLLKRLFLYVIAFGSKKKKKQLTIVPVSEFLLRPIDLCA